MTQHLIHPERRVAVIAGSAGVVARTADVVVAIGGVSSAVAAAMEQVRSAGVDLYERIRQLRDVDVAAVVRTIDGFETITIGNGLVATPDGQAVSSVSPVVWVGIGPVPSEAANRLVGSPHLALTEGCVPGQGALIEGVPEAAAAPSFEVVDFGSEAASDGAGDARSPLPVAESAPPPPAPPAAEPTDAGAPIPAAQQQPPGAPAAPPDDLPAPSSGSRIEVMGIQCSRGHFNNPNAAYCQVCGISMVHVTHYLVPGIRPTLGFLVFDDGATYALDRSYCVGREPTGDPDRLIEPLVLRDDQHTVSRSHAELFLDDWNLVVRDLGSTNGTFVWSSALGLWNRIMPDQPVVVEPGASVAVGRRVFTYESVARSV